MKANFRIFLEHPILGVGKDLSTAYAYDKYTQSELQLGEIARWNYMYKKEGPLGKNVLKSAFCEYIQRLAETGLVGLAVFLAPFFYVILFIIIKIKQLSRSNSKVNYICILVSLIASLVAGFNVGLEIVYCVWVLLGISFALFLDNRM